MNMPGFQINLLAAWMWILLGFVSGMLLGLFFHHDRWLGGYGSFRRRLYRLGHISFFGLGAANLFFWLTFRGQADNSFLHVASMLFVVGAVSMPLCCALMAHVPKARWLFAVPVVSLLVGGVCVLIVLFQLNERNDYHSTAGTVSVAQAAHACFCVVKTSPDPGAFNCFHL